MRTSHATTAGRTLARVLKAVSSLLVLAGALGALPLLLARATPVVWAASHDDLTHLLDRQETGGAFLVLLIAVGWFGWLQFTFCTTREMIARARGRSWHAPRGMAASQRVAAVLIGSILVLLPTSSALASPAQATPAATSARLPAQAQAPQHTGPERSASATGTTTSTYTVRQTQPADSLWSIAERKLGHGERWREIAALNEGKRMADGQTFRANSFLQPGWQLEMPTAGPAGGGHRQPSDGAPAANKEREHAVAVHSGDSLSQIAEDNLGNGAQWPSLFEASRGKTQPHGLPKITDPDMIYTGQQVTVPGTQSERHDRPHTPPRAGAPEGAQKPGTRHEDAKDPEASQSTTPAPETSTPSTLPRHPARQPNQDPGAGSATPSPSASPPAPTAAAPSPPHAHSPTATAPKETASSWTSPLQLRTVLGAGALLAAAATGALALRRLLQRRRRNPGEKIASNPQASPAEAQLAAAAEPGGAARLDVALRTLAHRAAQDSDGNLPQLRAARIGARTLEVLPDNLAREPHAPFTTGTDGWWMLRADADLLDDAAARDVPAPYPALVTVGSTETGDLVLLNLGEVTALLLDGNPVHITEVCTSLALELGMNPWAGDVEVVTIGFGEDLPQLLPTSRIAHMRQASHALRDLSARLLEAHQMPETSHQPYLLLCASTLTADTAWEFADVIDKAGTVPVTLVAPASTAAAHFPEAEILNASFNEPQPLDYTGTSITVQRLEHAAYQQITTALAVSGKPADPPQGPWREVLGEPVDIGPRPETSTPEGPAGQEKETNTDIRAAAPDPDDGDVFPALLAPFTDPAGLRLLSPAAADGKPKTTDPTDHEPEASDTPASPPIEPARGETNENERDEGKAHALHTPEIRVLGPIEVTEVASTGHGPRSAQLAALLYFRPGRNADSLCADMDPISPWSTSTLNARLQGLRRALGNDPDGTPYVPRRRTGDDPYRLSPNVRCDWTRFLQLAERALAQGPTGLPDLEKALTLVRGRPFGARPLPWAEPYQQEMITRIIDVAHTMAAHRTPPGPHHDLSKARQAVATGLDVDDSAELLYRDWMRIEHAAGNRSGLHTAIARIQQVNRAMDCSLETETEQIISDLLNGPGTAGRTAL